MIFARLHVDDALGLLLAHSAGRVKKGRVLSASDIASLKAQNIEFVFAAKLEADDVGEDDAARQLSQAMAGKNLPAQAAFTGRANLHSQVRGLLRVNAGLLARLNAIDEALTIAALRDYARVEPRQLCATVKIIPYGVKQKVLEQALSILQETALLEVHDFKPLRFGLVLTQTPTTKPSLLQKSQQMMQMRLDGLGAELAEVKIVRHDVEAVQQAFADMVPQYDGMLIFGASAIADRGDIVPQAIVNAGGEIIRLGMPVDPGNLLLMAQWQGKPVIGVPSCARSPKINGFDWVLERVVAGLSVTALDIANMGEGGLLMEIGSRPLPRETQFAAAPQVAGIILAAGQSSRMGENKLLMDFHGKPMVRHVVEAGLASGIAPLHVVTGRDAREVEAALADLPVHFVHNAGYASGLSTSLQAGLRSLPAQCDGAVVLLGDMPLVTGDMIARLVAAFSPVEGRRICVACHDGQFGNPVLWGRDFFPELLSLAGDKGGRGLLEAHGEFVVEVEAGSGAVLKDFDRREDFD